ncbi:MAG: hypothetical protein Q4F37_06290 [Corynebacterium sp.]|uniref:hypothetical protein n=1 Tax=Corynebacterium sp. TaxID=1720 RepID=UPI0026F59279|nr:hypothetical protein [Corynebacterium sp.]
MKLTKLTALVAAVAASTALAACGDDAGSEDTTTAEATSETTATETAVAEMPAATDLNEVLTTATDPEAPIEERRQTVQGGETVDQELFDTMVASQQESGAQFQVVDPVLPGYTPDSVLTTVNFTLPDMEPQVAENVEFVYEDDRWKLSQSWACTLVTNTVAPEQVPTMCVDPNAVPEEEAAPAEEQAPAEEPAAEDAPAEAPAEAPAQ